MTAQIPASSVATYPTSRDRLLRAIAGQSVDRPPVWLMRQAGRYLPEYQKIRAQYTFLEMCRIPDVAAEVSIQPYERFGIDAIIVFNDILIPFEYMGLSLDYTESGPILSPPIRSQENLHLLHHPTLDKMPAVYESIVEIRRRVGIEVPIIGFAGAPFTMASYAVEGSMTKHLRYAKETLHNCPKVWESLLELITETVIEYLRIQIKAGADVVQIFDTWAGCLTLSDYRRFAFPYQKQVIDAIQAEGTPVILYVNGSTPYLSEMKAGGAAVLSVDWHWDLQSVSDKVNGNPALQGNMDPAALFASPERVREMTLEILHNFKRKTGHIFNLGHGILPETPVESVAALVETVKSYEYNSVSKRIIG